MIKWITILLALVGLLLGAYTVATSDRDLGEPDPAAPPTVNPYARAVAASGLVEALGRNVELGAPEPGLVTDVLVEVNDEVAEGDPLFRLDRRPIEAELGRARAAVRVAEAQVERLQAEPRPESLPVLEAQVDAARAEAELGQIQLQRTETLVEERAAPREDLDRLRLESAALNARLAQAEATLAERQAGAWSRELAVAEAELAQAEAEVAALETRLDRLTVRAPRAGTILRRRVEPGVYVSLATGNSAPMVMGDLSQYRIRAQVDEQDMLSVQTNANATARLRGGHDVQLPLRMVRIEPLAEPKRQLTGVPTELVDTRVIDVIFEVIDRDGIPLYPGQIVDVFIEQSDNANIAMD
ncbi:HlyD family secretion protein [Phycisphaerales bacterium AB-hyl4]|uniref:HlyD family secretion protein n=1 Tax=Natronomicrosphaera hydrolytica TaxID=3242702 RepID=A0ABV4U6I2_9BACT